MNGLMPEGNKPLPKYILTYHQWGPMAFIWWNYHEKIWIYQWKKFDNCTFKFAPRSPRDKCVKILKEKTFLHHWLHQKLPQWDLITPHVSAYCRQVSIYQHSKCREISIDIFGHFDWCHPVKNGSSKTPLTNETSSRICLTVHSSLFLLMA